MKTLLSRLSALCVTSAVLAAGVNADALKAVPEDLSYSAALYEYHRGNFQPSMLHLAVSEQDAVGDGFYRHQLAGQASLSLGHYEEAQRYFDQVLGQAISADLKKRIVFPLAKVKYARGECEQTLELLNSLDDLSAEQGDHVRYIQVICMLKTASPDAQTLAAAEKVLAEPLQEKRRDYTPSIWFSYGFYNLAVAASKAGLTADSVRLYELALLYTGSSDEGRALRDRIRLSLAYTNYDLNRYEFAMNHFGVLDMDGLWADKSLLGYGWAAFKNYKPGLALESWRQLIYLPYKSVSVYEGYIAIPFALEKANAFSEALTAYDKAIVEYDNVLSEIAQLEADLDRAGILKHALEYRSKEREAVEPLHPLLGGTYAQESFRMAVEQIGQVDAYQQRLKRQSDNLSVLVESRERDKADTLADQQRRRAQESEILGRLESLQQKIFELSDTVLARSVAGIDDPEWRKGYQAYKKLTASVQADVDQQLVERVNRLRGVLFWHLYDEDPGVAADLQKITVLTDAYQELYAGYIEYRQLDRSPLEQAVQDRDFQALSARLDAAESKGEVLMNTALDELLLMTRQALAAQKKRIVFYQKQARIASARLHEEFYQLGGRNL